MSLRFLGDGSFYLLDTPDHMAGHLGALEQTGAGEWIFIGGYCCRHRALHVGMRPVSVTIGPHGTSSFHSGPETAIKSIVLVRKLERSSDAFVALAQDAILVGRMPLYPKMLKGWRNSSWKKEVDKDVRKPYLI